MRLIHTSDWHLGQTLHEQDRHYEHAAFLDWLLTLIEAEQPDLLVVAGDVYDSINPPVAAQRLLFDFVRRARECLPTLTLLMIAGNHDSGARIEMPVPLLEVYGAHAVGQVAAAENGRLDLDRLIVPVRGAGGSALVLALPFLRPAEITGAGQQDYAEAVSRVHRDLIEAARRRRAPGEHLIVVSHAYVDGGADSDSVRRLVAGGSERVSPTLFPADVDYVALGHLHLAQAIAGATCIRYCGSPLPLAFSEVEYRHQVLCVDLATGHAPQVRSVPVPRAVPMLRIPAAGPGPLSQVLAELSALRLPPCAPEARPWLQVRVVLDAPMVDLRERIQALLVDQPVRWIDTIRGVAGSAADDDPVPQIAALEPTELFRRAWLRRYGTEPDAQVLADFAAIELEADEAAR